jgi:hypothetical protein
MIKPILLAAALVGAASSANAYPNDTKNSAAAAQPRPVPSSVVSPEGVPWQFEGAVIHVEFSLDAAGQPRDIKLPKVYDEVLERQLIDAFRRWRFAPVASAPGAKSPRYILPVQLTPKA